MTEPTTTMTAVKTKTVTRTQMAVALACLGASIIAAAAMSIAGNNTSSVCVANVKVNVELALGEGTLVSVCKNQTIVPPAGFDKLSVRKYDDNTLTLFVNKKNVIFKVGNEYKPVGKPVGDIIGYQQNLYVSYAGKVEKRADINLFYGYPAGGDGVFCSDTDESQKNFDGTAVKDFKFVNPYVKGTASYYDEETDEMVPVEDSCITYDYGYYGAEASAITNNLQEGYCSTADGGKWFSKVITCEGGCVDGACVPVVAPPIVEPVTPSSTPQTASSTFSFTSVKPYTSPKYSIPGQTVDLAKYEIKNGGTESVKVKSIKFTQLIKDEKFSVSSDIKSLWLVDEAGTVLSESFFPYNQTPLVEINKADLIVAGGKTKTITLKGIVNDMVGYSNGPAYSGHIVSYKINDSKDVTATSVSSLQAGLVTLESTANTSENLSYVFKAYPVLTKKSVATSKLANGTRDLFKFEVTAVNDDISLNKFGFLIQLTKVQLSNLYLYDVTDLNGGMVVNSKSGTLKDLGNAVNYFWSTSGSDWKINHPTGEIFVSKTQPRTFVLRGNVGGATMGSAISTQILGTKSCFSVLNIGNGNSMGSVIEVDSVGGNSNNVSFIWSDQSVADHSESSKDWTDGCGVPGLLSSGSQFETIAY